MTRHPADRLPISIIFGLTAIDFVVYFNVDNIWLLAAYFLLMTFPRACICAWSHHHQHTKTFRSTLLNRVLEQGYALHTGVTTNLWLLHHVFGHHHNYLDQSADESRWKRKSGKKMGELEYSFNVAITAYYRGIKVGRRYPKHLRNHLIFSAVTLVLVTALMIYRPLPGLLIFALPMIVGLFITAWVTYDHHAGLETEDHFAASFNNMNPLLNFLTGNLGFHTAHHYKQGTHWSELPALHETIKAKIPAELYRRDTFWDLMIRLPLLRNLFPTAQTQG